MIAWSYSALSAFTKCPAQYKAVRVDKLYPYVQGPEAAEGERQHKAFENYILKGETLPANMSHHTPMVQALAAIPGKKHPEMKLAVDANGNACQYFDRTVKVWVRAAADLVIERRPEYMQLADFKSGKSRYADTSQLKLTALLLFAKFPALQQVDSALLFTKENKVVPVSYNRDESPKYWSEFLPEYQKLVRAHETNTFHPKPSGLCTRCPHVRCGHNRSGGTYGQ